MSARSSLACLLILLAAGCSERRDSSILVAEPQLNLARVLDRGRVESAAPPLAAREQRRWVFNESQPDWRPLSSEHAGWLSSTETAPTESGLRLSISRPSVQRTMLLIGGLYIELEEELRLEDWDAVLIRARSSDRFAGITIAHNLDVARSIPGDMVFFFSTDEAPPIFSDGSEQTYAIPLRARDDESGDTRLESLGVLAAAIEPAALEILSIQLVPRGADYLDDYGVRHAIRDGELRTTLFAHTPATATYELEVPPGGRLDVGLTVEPSESVRYRIIAAQDETEPRVLFDEAISDTGSWQQRSIDLSALAGATVRLALEATSERDGTVGFWGAPVVSRAPGAAGAARPNVIFYVIDGGGSDLMSLYGYERPTTPFLEKLAAEGAVFERAYSNSTWTQPSTVSFMTSLQHSVLGGLRRGVHSTPVPTGAITMAEHFAAAGYQTASFSANPNSGRIIGLERGVDVMRDSVGGHHSTSSAELHEFFWRLREDYPGAPWWVHFQTTDVHEPNQPEPPYAGRFVEPAQERRLREWDQRIFQVAGAEFGRTSISNFYDLALARAEIDRHAYFDTRRGLYDETMLHQDAQLARFIEELKERGLWQSTLLVIGADHGHPAGSFARFGRGLLDPQPDPWEGALFDSYSTRVPMLFIWPGHIPAGPRFEAPVSMIDVLPTLLDLVGLPRPQVLQGQSLAPMLTGGDQELREVILDEFRIDDASGEMIGNLEIIDGRWGASLEIGPTALRSDPTLGRHAVPAGGRWGALHPDFPSVPSLLLYDLEKDPFATRAVNDQHPNLVEQYRARLLELWQAHLALSERFGEAPDVTLSSEQLEQLRALGYIQ